MNEKIRENIVDLSDFGSILPLVKGLEVKAFNYKKVVDQPAVEEYEDPQTGRMVAATPETYYPYPEGIQVMIEPSSLELTYPEGVVTDSDGTQYYRAELVTAFLVQAVKELHEDFSKRIAALESKIK